MDFFESQERAHRRTKVLVVYFALAVAAIIAAVYFLLFFLGFDQIGAESASAAAATRSLWNPEMLGGTALAVGLLVGIGSGVKTIQLSSGGGTVARDLGGRLVDPATTDLAEQKLMNVVEEMALASGTPVPEVYVMDHEQGINAFAAGKTPSDAAIGVTRGCIETLSRDELQGVIAHEFSHILNGDMRLSTRLIGLLQGILLLSIIGQILLRVGFFSGGSRGGGDNKGGGGALPILLLGLGLILIGAIGVFFGKLIKAAISRQREFLADASAVQFTRNPDGIGNALKKIGGAAGGSRVKSPRAEEASHLFFANGMRASFLSMLATHPPLGDRIRAIDPQWDGQFLRPESRTPVRPATAPKTGGSAKAGPPPLPFPFPLGAGAGAETVAPHLQPSGILGAATGAVILAEAASLRDQLVQAIDVHQPPNAVAVIYSLLLSRDKSLRASQLEFLANHAQPAVAEALPAATRAVDELAGDRKLPMVDLCLPALRQLSGPQYESFRANLDHLIASDKQVDLFEFCLKSILQRRLDLFHKETPIPKSRIRGAAEAKGEIQLLLSALTHLSGSSRPGDTFQSATRKINLTGADWRLQPVEDCGVDKIEAALARLASALPMVRKNLLYACGQLVMEDQHVTRSELQLLRAIAELLETPIPPFVSTKR